MGYKCFLLTWSWYKLGTRFFKRRPPNIYAQRKIVFERVLMHKIIVDISQSTVNSTWIFFSYIFHFWDMFNTNMWGRSSAVGSTREYKLKRSTFCVAIFGIYRHWTLCLTIKERIHKTAMFTLLQLVLQHDHLVGYSILRYIARSNYFLRAI